MPGSDRFTGIIEAKTVGEADLQRFTGALEKVTASLDKSGQKAQEHKGSFDKFAESVKNAVENPLQAAGAAAESFLTKLGPVGVGVAAGAATLGVMAVKAFELSKQISELAHNAEILATELGVSAQSAQLWQRMAEMEGAGADRLTAGIRKLSQVMEDTGPAGKELREEFQKLGVTLYDIHTGAILPMDQLFPSVLKHLGEMEAGTKQTALAAAAFGRGGLSLLPMAKEFDELSAAVKRSGAIMDEEAIAKAREYHKQLEEIGLAWDALKVKIGVPIVGVISFLLQGEGTSGNPGYAPIPRGYGAIDGARAQAARAFRPMGPEFTPEDKAAISAEIAKNDEMVQAILDGSRDKLSAAKSKLQDLYGQLRTGVLPEADASTEAQIAQQKVEIAALENAAKLAEIQARNAKALADLAEKGRAGIGWRSMMAGRAMMGDTNIVSLPGVSRWMTPGALTNFNYGGPDLVNSLPIEDRSGGYNAHLFASSLSDEGKKLADQIREGEAALKEDDRIRADLSKQALENEKKIAELRQKAEDQYVESVERGFDALISSGAGGFGAFLKSQATGLERTMVGNVARMTYGGMGGRLSMTDDPNSFTGRLLAGTPFGADPLKAATSENTIATVANTLAIQRMTAISASGGGGGRVASSIGGFLPFLGSSDYDAGVAAITGGIPGVGIPEMMQPSSGGGGFSWGKGLGIGGAALGGIFGTISGIRSGGARGALTAGGSLAGASGAILGLAGVSGPAAPIMMGVGLAMGLITSLFGDPKAERAKEMSDFMQARRFQGADPVSYSVDMYGRTVDYDMRGNLRPIVQYITIQALDTANLDTYLAKNADVLNRAVGRAVDQGGTMVPKLQQAMGLA